MELIKYARTQVCYLRGPKFTLPYLKKAVPISTKFIYFMLYMYTTFHAKFERNLTINSRDIRSQKSSDFLRILFFLRTKPEII